MLAKRPKKKKANRRKTPRKNDNRLATDRSVAAGGAAPEKGAAKPKKKAAKKTAEPGKSVEKPKKTKARPAKNRSQEERPRVKVRRALARGWRAAGYLLAFSLTGAALWSGWSYLVRSPHFAVDEVRIRGNSKVSVQTIIDLAGLGGRPNIFSLDLGRVRRDIEFHPDIRETTVFRRLPNALAIEVEERRPKALASLDGLYLVDEGGEVYRRLEPGEKLDLPILTGFTLKGLVARGSWERRMLEQAFKIIDLARRGEAVREKDISEIHADPAIGLSMVTTCGLGAVTFGDEDLARKWARLERVARDLRKRKAEAGLVNLNLKGRATVRLGGS